MDKKLEAGMQRVKELLHAHAASDRATSASARGLVTVTVDSRLQLTSVKLQEKSLDEGKRAELERAIVDAVNMARITAVKAAGESLSALRDSADWKSAMDEIFGRSART